MPSLTFALSKNVPFSADKSRALLSFPLLPDPKSPNIYQCALPGNLGCSAAVKFRPPLNRTARVCHAFSTDAAVNRRRNGPTSRFLTVQMWGSDRFAMAKITGVMTAYFVALSLYASSAGASTPEEAFVKETVSSHDIVIFSKSYCPYCKRAKAVFKELSKEPHVIELDQRGAYPTLMGWKLESLNVAVPTVGSYPHSVSNLPSVDWIASCGIHR